LYKRQLAANLLCARKVVVGFKSRKPAIKLLILK